MMMRREDRMINIRNVDNQLLYPIILFESLMIMNITMRITMIETA
jgi:hypothetical protein